MTTDTARISQIVQTANSPLAADPWIELELADGTSAKVHGSELLKAIMLLANPVELGTARFAAGALGMPGLTPSGDTDTGFDAPAANQIGCQVGGFRSWIAKGGQFLIGLGASILGYSLEISASAASVALVRYSSSQPALLGLCRSRSDVAGTNTIVQSGDELAEINFRGANGTGFDIAASIRASVAATPGTSNDMPGKLAVLTSADGSATPTERWSVTTKVTMTPLTNQEAMRVGSFAGLSMFGGGYLGLCTNAYSDGSGAFNFLNALGSSVVGQCVISPMRTEASTTIGGVFTAPGNSAANTVLALGSWNKALTWDTSGKVGCGKVPSSTNQLDVNGSISVSDNVIADANGHHRLRSYTIAGLPSASPAGQVIYCSDLGGGGGQLNSNGTVWRRVSRGGQQTVNTDADFTLTTLTSAEEQKHTGTLTADRTITLATTNASSGARFRVTRTGTGAFNLSVGGLKNLATNTWAEVIYDGAAWYLAAYGAL